MQARPTYEFYIPSIHDDKALACRIYSLPELYFGGNGEDESTGKKPWTPKGCIIAHPYTRLGGSYDDPTVLHLVAQLLRFGFTVGTFNLRGAGKGAGKSQGRSTWSSKAELKDYISFVGFFMYYLSNLYPPIPMSESFDNYFPLAPVLSGVPATRPPAHLLLAGYSYGALLTRYLPNIPAVLGRFSKVLKTSTEAEIRLRASRLAALTTIDILSGPLHGARESRRALKGKAVDRGNGNAAAAERVPRDWAAEKLQHINILQTRFVREEKKDSYPDQPFGVGPDDEDFIERIDVPTPKTHYLLVSLLLEPVSMLCTRFQRLNQDDDLLDAKFLFNTTLVVHGGKDRFTSVKKLSYWGAEIEEQSEGRFTWVQIPESGHFWREEKEYLDLSKAINQWVPRWLYDDSQSVGA
ncbi:MAG: hypothetical protein Q9170_006380 [Blastenia crenularia]